MPKGVYQRTQQARENIGKAQIGRIPWNKGKIGIYSEETLRKISENNWCRGKKNPQLTEANLKRVYTSEMRKKMSERQKGEKGSNYRGGIADINNLIRHSIEYKLWREEVFIRDDYTCWKCNQRGKRIHAHHIVGFSTYPEGRFDINNGATLCIKCHNDYHKIYGVKQVTRERFESYLIISTTGSVNVTSEGGSVQYSTTLQGLNLA